jgi:hypothetical protein
MFDNTSTSEVSNLGGDKKMSRTERIKLIAQNVLTKKNMQV